MTTIRKTYTKPEIEVLEMDSAAVMKQFQSGFNVDGKHEGYVDSSGESGLSEDNKGWGLND